MREARFEDYEQIAALESRFGLAVQPYNEWIHLWRYKNLEERFKARGDAMKDPDWQAYLAKGPPLLAEMHSTLLMPTNYSPLK